MTSEAYQVATSGVELVLTRVSPGVWDFTLETDTDLSFFQVGLRGGGGGGPAVFVPAAAGFTGCADVGNALCVAVDGAEVGAPIPPDVLYVSGVSLAPGPFAAAVGSPHPIGTINALLPEWFGVGLEPSTPFSVEGLEPLFGSPDVAVDFNNVPVPVTFVSVPEPGSMWLLLGAAAGLAALRRRSARS